MWLAGAGGRMAMVKGLMVEKIEGHINGGNAEVRVCMSLVWIVDVCKVLLQYRQFLLSLLLFHLSRRQRGALALTPRQEYVCI